MQACRHLTTKTRQQLPLPLEAEGESEEEIYAHGKIIRGTEIPGVLVYRTGMCICVGEPVTPPLLRRRYNHRRRLSLLQAGVEAPHVTQRNPCFCFMLITSF